MGRTVLLIEDDADVAGLMALVLDSEGYKVLVGRTGAEALAVARAAAVRPDAVLLDLTLPDMPGVAVGVALQRELGYPAARIIVLSGDGAGAERAGGIAAGAFLSKPVDIDILSRTLARVCDGPAAA